MEKLIGLILLGLAIAIALFIYMNLGELSSNAIPIPDKILDLFKIKPFE